MEFEIFTYFGLEEEAGLNSSKMKNAETENTPQNLKVSGIVIAKNAGRLIADALESLDWVGEVILVDTGSTDETVKVGEKYNANIVKTAKGGFSDWRNLAAEKASGDWLFFLDTDERVTPLLRKEILSVISHRSSVTNPPAAYAIPRKNIILGQLMRWGGWWPDYAIRLFYKPLFGGWRGELHEEPQYQGQLGYLKNSLIHLKHDNFEEMVEKTNEWSEIEAKLMFEANHPPMNAVRFFSAGFREFWLRFVRHLAFLDGPKGIMYGLYQVYSRLISYAKLWEMQINIKRQK